MRWFAFFLKESPSVEGRSKIDNCIVKKVKKRKKSKAKKIKASRDIFERRYCGEKLIG